MLRKDKCVIRFKTIRHDTDVHDSSFRVELKIHLFNFLVCISDKLTTRLPKELLLLPPN